jgi:GDP-4-dehydro-6-deoxy-D-mannose reductase
MPRQTLVTGAQGFVGRHLLAELGDEAVPLQADITDFEALREDIERERPSAVVHLAAQSSVASSWEGEREAWLVNAVGTVNLLAAVRAAQPEARVLLVSTGDVYGRAAELPTPEEAPVRPLSPYAASKAAAELAAECARRAEDRDTIVVRPFTHIGPGQSDVFAVGSWTSQIARLEEDGGGTLRVGNLDVQRDLTDVRDVCRAYGALLDPVVPAATYNVASGTVVRLGDVVELLIGLARRPIAVEQDPARSRPVDIPIQHGDASRLAAATGWRPSIPLEQTLSDALDYARAALPRERTSAG